MGGENYNDAISTVTVVFGGGAIDDGNWPGDVIDPEALDPDTDWDSIETVPPSHMTMVQRDKPNSITDYPIRICAATGLYGAPSAMVNIDGRWYLRAYAPDPRRSKKYWPRFGNKP